MIIADNGFQTLPTLTLDDHHWRLAWAAYFDARAKRSIANGVEYPQHAKIWNDKAMAEQECAIILRMTEKSLPELFVALEQTIVDGKPA